MLSYGQVDMDNRLFSRFTILTISPPLIHQLQTRYIRLRNIFSARENASKTYNWFVFVFAAFLVEIPWSILVGTIYYFCWYWGVGFPGGASAAGYVWLALIAFEVYYISFGQAIAAVSPNAALSSLLAPSLFCVLIDFCGVLVPPQAMPNFWSRWIYCMFLLALLSFFVADLYCIALTPFHYLLDAMMAVVVHDQPVICNPEEFATFYPPQGQTCQQFVDSYIRIMGGYLQDPGNTTLCKYCQYANGDEFVFSHK